MSHTDILIVDDESSVLEGLVEFLEDEGYRVHPALDGAKGLDIFHSIRPNLVMTDLRMPGISGIELIQEIRKANDPTQVIVVTGYGTLESAIDAIRMDVFDFITKPIDLESLKNTLDRARDAITATQEIQEEMNLLRKQLQLFQAHSKEQLSKFAEVEPLIHMGRLLAGILHNLNNPLSYIMGQTELLQIFHPEIENLGVIREQAIRMNKIMSTIMKRVKQTQCRQVEWLQINDILQEEVLFLEAHPYFKVDISKEWHLSPDLPLIRGAAGEFSQIFGNILRNAAEAMREQRTRNLVISSWLDSMGIHVSIADNGPGVPSHLTEKIFEPFFSTKTPNTCIVGTTGMGIGLYHCREMIRQYGGHIEVESSPGSGATFTVSLPLSLTQQVSLETL